MAESEDNEVLTREKCAPEGILPTGRKVGVIPVRGISMYTLGYVDGKPGTIPAEYSSKFTGLTYAQAELRRFVNDLWNVSESVSRKRNKTLSLNNAVS